MRMEDETNERAFLNHMNMIRIDKCSINWDE